MELLLAIVSGMTLGCLHAFDADHVIAVSTFVTKHPQPRKAALLGLSWGLGHTATVFLLGLASLTFRFVVSPLVETVAELGVGVLLTGVGIWALAGLFRRKSIHIHKHEHDGLEHMHFHSHGHSGGHQHRHSMFFIGATHGFAGTATIMVIIPVALTQNLLSAALYLLLFCAGTVTAMTVIAYVVGRAAEHLRSRHTLIVFQGLAGVASICTGLLWIGQRI